MHRYTILPKTIQVAVSEKTLKDAAVVAHLYYEERFANSFSYLKNVPPEVDVYIVTANPALEAAAREAIREAGCKNISIITKPNQGRDFAALLIAAREVLDSHSYIGFIHDKRNHPGEPKTLTDIWEKYLFECVIGSGEYISWILHRFENDPRLGLFSAPTPPIVTLLGLAGVLWTHNYLPTLRFLRKIGVTYRPCRQDDPLTIGSAFWFRTKAFEKLLSYPWTYEDFPPEPMPNDGTIAHILERAMEAICVDAGYRAGYVLNDNYAEAFITRRSEQLTTAMCIIREAGLMVFTRGNLDLPLALQRLRERRMVKHNEQKAIDGTSDH
ncbi:MAG: hypothetical protein IJT62_01820 [Oscillospiraceae bacterium]|nr:hypothetical protein [Oscillospiraceae bacterium]